jgi:hypothetical protein
VSGGRSHTQEVISVANTPERRNAIKAARIWSPAGKMPPTWKDMTLAQKMQFTQADRQALKEGEFWWAPVPEHGNWNAYNNNFCRCPLCARANATKKAEYRAAKTE